MDRRDFIGIGVAAGALVAAQPGAAYAQSSATRSGRPLVAPGGPVAVVTPNGSTLPWRRSGDKAGSVKVGHLIAQEIAHEFAPGLEATCWGYNGSTPGPTIEAIEGDRVRIYVTNRLPEATTVHWHGVLVPSGMDGVAGLTQRSIKPGETFKYEFTFNRAGTYMYHPHFDEMTQMALGMMGMIVVHPRVARGPRVDRDFVLMTHEWKIRPGMRRPDPMAMNDFNVLTFNSKSFPATAPLVVGTGERVRIRFGNLSAMDHHPIHMHGYYAKVTATDGGAIPEAAQVPETTVLVPVGSTRTVEFVADAPGDWAMHCHMTHHVMTQMGHEIPVMIGADARRIDRSMDGVVRGYMTMGHDGMGAMAKMDMPMPRNSLPMRATKGPHGPIDMGGMFTLIKVRDNPAAEDGSGWYQAPPGTQADVASAADLKADGIDPNA
jgi:FtsP/CotA-like multicopper oxidase with cupredoxin domain